MTSGFNENTTGRNEKLPMVVSWQYS